MYQRDDQCAVYNDLMEGKDAVCQNSRYFGKSGLQPVQNLGVFSSQSSFCFGILLKVSRQGISSSISFTLSIIDLEMVSKKVLSPTNLLRAQAFYVHKVVQVVVVRKNEDLILAIF